MEILIAEDDRPSRRVLEARLAKWGHAVVACIDGGEAWEKLQREDAPRLAILDWMMPVLDGIEVCRMVREMPHANRIYILILTARGEKEDIVAGLKAGANDYVTKPVDEEELQARVQVGVRMVELQDQLLESERLRALTETAGAAAHEINQPLTIILGKADILLDKMAPEDPHRRHIVDLQQAGQKITGIVRKMEAAQQYVTKPYILGVDIVDFEASARDNAQDEQ